MASMKSIKFTIEEYETSHKALQNRICELNAQISGNTSGRQDSSVKHLLERRGIMYIQLWDIEFAIRELREYLILQNRRKGVKQEIG